MPIPRITVLDEYLGRLAIDLHVDIAVQHHRKYSATMNHDSEEDLSDDPALLRATQLNTLTDEYARLWRAEANLHRIHELESLLERLVKSTEPIEFPDWFVIGADGPLPGVRTAREIHTCLHLIDPALAARGWTSDLITREETFKHCGSGERKRVDYALRVRMQPNRLLRLVALIEAKHEGCSPERGLAQVKAYAAGRRERIRFVFSTNGHHYVQYDRRKKVQSDPQPLYLFPTPEDLIEVINLGQ